MKGMAVAALVWGLMIAAFEVGKHGQAFTVVFAYPQPPVYVAPVAPTPLWLVADHPPCHPACAIWEPDLCR